MVTETFLNLVGAGGGGVWHINWQMEEGAMKEGQFVEQ